jgi:glutathionylspermidine synthase
MTIATPLKYSDFAQKLYNTCIITDAWIDGHERFSLQPIILSENTLFSLYYAAESIGKIYEELCEIVWNEPRWIDEYFHLTPYQKFMWLSSGGQWHGISRLDLFLLTDDRIQMCEMNSDTPSGEAETVLLNELFHPNYPDTINPNKQFPEKFYAMLIELFHSSNPSIENPTVGIVYPTEMPEDLSMIAIYQRWLEQHGCKVVLGSPYNLHRPQSGKLYLFDEPIDILLRHYKTDWWGERISAWSDVEFPDPDPLDLQLRQIIDAELNNDVTIINPFGSVLTQNKLTMSFFHEHILRFSDESRKAIKSFIPETYRLTGIDPQSLDKRDWVLKSDYGCEGDEVIIGRFTTDEIWSESLLKAVPEHWILQKFFEAKTDIDGFIPNYGVYLLGGEASGIYTRLSKIATDYTSITVPTFIGSV